MALDIRSATGQPGTQSDLSLEGAPGQAAISDVTDERIRRVIAAVHFCQEGEKLTEDEVVAMIRYCDAHSDSDVVRRQESGLARTVLTGAEGYILMTLNRNGRDKVIGEGVFKQAKFAVSTTGKVGVVTVCREEKCLATLDPKAWDSAKAEIAHMQELKGEEGIVQMVAAHVIEDASLSIKVKAIMMQALEEEDLVVEKIRDYVTYLKPPKNKAYIVMEYCEGGDLFGALIAEPSFLRPNDRRQIALDCARGLNNMRKRNWIHRDLKPENIFLLNGERNVHAKVGDFGYACSLDDVNSCDELVGSPAWFSPEKAKAFVSIQNGSPPASADCAAASTEASEVWTLGLLLAVILRTEPCFLRCQDGRDDRERAVTMVNVNQGKLDREIDKSKIYDEFKSLIKKMLRVDPKARPTMAEVLKEMERISKR